ncbi:MAG: TonB-dependent receptor [Pseudomonadota bacterium]|jgi:iron complex outermembrane receptor protein
MKLRLTACTLLSLAAPLTAPAADDTELAEMTVRGARPALDPALPAVAEGVDARRLADLNVVNVEDGLRYLPSLLVRKRFIGDRNGVVASRSSGSLQGARSLAYVDGMLLSNLLGNSFGNTPRWGMVAPEEIARMDVIYGPYSALYPGNSMGATVVMTTRDPEGFEATGRVQGFVQQYDYYHTDDRFGGHQENATLGGRSGAWSWFAAVNHLENRSHPMTWATSVTPAAPAGGETVVTGYAKDLDPSGKERVIFGATGIDDSRQDTLKLKLGYEPAPWLKLTYLFGYWQNDSDISVDSYLRNGAGQTVYSGAVNIEGRRYVLNAATFQPGTRREVHSLHGLALRSDTRGEWDGELVLTRYNFDQDESRWPSGALPAAAGGGAGTVADGEGTGWRTADAKIDWRPAGGRHVLSFGGHYDRYLLRSVTRNASDWKSGAPTTERESFGGKTETHALFVQDAWRFAPAWSLTTGLRFERWRAFDGRRSTSSGAAVSYGERRESFWSPKLSLAHDLNAEWRLRGSLGRAWRMPTVSEMFQTQSAAGTTLINNDPNLRAERATSAEFTAERALASGLLRLTLFRDAVRDALYSQTNTAVTPNVTSIQNVDHVRTDGIELAYTGENVGMRGLDVSGGVTYADSRIVRNDKNPASVGKRMPRIPDWRANLAATWRQSERLAWTLGLRHSGRQTNTLDNSDINPDTYGGTSRYTLWDAKLGWQMDKRLRLSLGVDNLFDRRVFVAHPYPGRTVVLELRGSL